MFRATRVSVTATRTLIAPFNSKRQLLFIQNAGGQVCQIGGETLTFGSGLQLAVGVMPTSPQSMNQFVSSSKAAWYAICNTGLSTTIHILEYVRP